MVWFDDGGNEPPHEPRYCAKCRRLVSTWKGDGWEECRVCGRRWSVAHRETALERRLARREARAKGQSRGGAS